MIITGYKFPNCNKKLTIWGIEVFILLGLRVLSVAADQSSLLLTSIVLFCVWFLYLFHGVTFHIIKILLFIQKYWFRPFHWHLVSQSQSNLFMYHSYTQLLMTLINNLGLDVTTLFLCERYVDGTEADWAIWYTGSNVLIACHHINPRPS